MDYFNKPTVELPAVMRPIPCKDTRRMSLGPMMRGACVAYLGDASKFQPDWELFRGVESHYPGGYASFIVECGELLTQEAPCTGL